MSNNHHTILYIMRHIDIGQQIDIPYKKIGITGSGKATLDSRLQQISNTKSPIKAQCIAAWEHENAKSIEEAIHGLLEDCRVEGEWFLDKDDSLVERMEPIMELVGAKKITIKETDDPKTNLIMKIETSNRLKSDQTLLGELSQQLTVSLRSNITTKGITLTSTEKQLTYFIRSRKSGKHNLLIGRSKGVFDDLENYILSLNYGAEKSPGGNVRIMGVNIDTIVDIINNIESHFDRKLDTQFQVENITKT